MQLPAETSFNCQQGAAWPVPDALENELRQQLECAAFYRAQTFGSMLETERRIQGKM